MKIIPFIKEYYWFAFGPFSACVGWYVEKRSKDQLTMFQNKSRLFGREPAIEDEQNNGAL